MLPLRLPRAQEAAPSLDKLLTACWNHKKDNMEHQVLNEEQPPQPQEE